MLNVEPCSSVIFKTYHSEFDDIIIIFTDQNGLKDFAWHCLLISRNDILFYKPRKKKGVKGYGFLPFVRYLSDKYGEKLFDASIKIGLDSAKAASKNLIHKTSEASGELIGNKIDEKILKPKPVPNMNSRNVE